MPHSVNEKSTATLEITFFDENDEPTIPNSIEYTIDDYETGENLESGSLTPNKVVTLQLTPDVNTILDNENDDIRVVKITANYGIDDQHIERFMYQIGTV